MKSHRSTGLQGADVVLPLDNPEAALCLPMCKPSFYTATEETPTGMLQPLWKAFLCQEVALALGTAPQAQSEDATESQRTDVEDCTEERDIGDKVKAPVNQLVAKEVVTLVEKWLDDILSPSYHNTQSGIRSLVYCVTDQVMLNLLQRDVVLENLNTHIEKCFATGAASHGISKKLFTTSSYMAPIATYYPCETKSPMADHNTVFSKESNQEPIPSTEAYSDIIQEQSS